MKNKTFYITIYENHPFKVGEVLQTGTKGYKLLVVKEVWWKRFLILFGFISTDTTKLRVKNVTQNPYETW